MKFVWMFAGVSAFIFAARGVIAGYYYGLLDGGMVAIAYGQKAIFSLLCAILILLVAASLQFLKLARRP